MFLHHSNNKEITLTSSLYPLFETELSKGDLKKIEIINAAIKILATDGLAKTTYESLAKELGTNRAHINYYFKSKSEILFATISYIVHQYQEISLAYIEKAQSRKEIFKHYICAPFIWAKKHPKQLSVMLLFYHLCTLRNDDGVQFKKMHNKIRQAGVDRMTFILKEDFKINDHEAENIAKVIQNHISGAILDSATITKKSLFLAQKETLELAQLLIKERFNSSI